MNTIRRADLRGWRVLVAVVMLGMALVRADDARAAASDPVVTVGTASPGQDLYGIASGPDGSIFVGGRGVVVRLHPDGAISHVAGRPWAGIEPLPSANGARAQDMFLGDVGALAVTDDRSVWIAGDGRVRRVDPQGTVRELAGDGWTAEPSTGEPSLYGHVVGMATMADGSVVVASGHGDVTRLDAAGNQQALLRRAPGAPYLFIQDIAVAPNGAVYIAGAGQVFRVAGGETEVIAGAVGGNPGDSAESLSALGARLGDIRGLVVESTGDLLVATESRVRRIHMDESPMIELKPIGTVAGVRRAGSTEGTVGTVRFGIINDLAMRGDDLYIIDDDRIRRLPGITGSPDLPYHPGRPPTLSFSAVPATVEIGDEWEGPALAPAEAPVTLTMTATSPDGTPIHETIVYDMPTHVMTVSGGTAVVTLKSPGLHLLVFIVTDDLGNFTVVRKRVLVGYPAGTCPAGGVPDDGFIDVPISNVHEPAIDCAAWLGIVQGLGPSTFAPGASVRRDQMATILAQALDAAGASLPPGPDAFDDDNENMHEANLNRLAAAGLITGTGPRRYDANLLVTRAQMATFLVRGYETIVAQRLPPAPDRFTDDIGNVHAPRINQAAQVGLTSGVGGTRFAPNAHVRRDQLASFVIRLLDSAQNVE